MAARHHAVGVADIVKDFLGACLACSAGTLSLTPTCPSNNIRQRLDLVNYCLDEHSMQDVLGPGNIRDSSFDDNDDIQEALALCNRQVFNAAMQLPMSLCVLKGFVSTVLVAVHQQAHQQAHQASSLLDAPAWCHVVNNVLDLCDDFRDDHPAFCHASSWHGFCCEMLAQHHCLEAVRQKLVFSIFNHMDGRPEFIKDVSALQIQQLRSVRQHLSNSATFKVATLDRLLSLFTPSSSN